MSWPFRRTCCPPTPPPPWRPPDNYQRFQLPQLANSLAKLIIVPQRRQLLLLDFFFGKLDRSGLGLGLCQNNLQICLSWCSNLNLSPFLCVVSGQRHITFTARIYIVLKTLDSNSHCARKWHVMWIQLRCAGYVPQPGETETISNDMLCRVKTSEIKSTTRTLFFL